MVATHTKPETSGQVVKTTNTKKKKKKKKNTRNTFNTVSPYKY